MLGPWDFRTEPPSLYSVPFNHARLSPSPPPSRAHVPRRGLGRPPPRRRQGARRLLLRARPFHRPPPRNHLPARPPPGGHGVPPPPQRQGLSDVQRPDLFRRARRS